MFFLVYYNVKGLIFVFPIRKMAGKRLSMNIFGSRPAIMTSKIAT
jgi:hypothetical protein